MYLHVITRELKRQLIMFALVGSHSKGKCEYLFEAYFGALATFHAENP